MSTNWFEAMGFRPVVRRGPLVAVSGLGGVVDETGTTVGGDAHEQTVRALAKLERTLSTTGATRADVLQTRIYVRDADDWPAVGRAHGEFFAGTEVAMTMVGAALVDPQMLVEIEALAWSPER